MSLHDRPPDPIVQLQLTNRIFVLEQAIDNYRIENLRLKKSMEMLQTICDNLLPKSALVSDNSLKTFNNRNNDCIQSEEITPINQTTNTTPTNPSDKEIIKNTLQSDLRTHHRQIIAKIDNLPYQTIAKIDNLPYQTIAKIDDLPNQSNTPYLDAVKYCPIKYQPHIKQKKTATTTTTMKRSINFNNKSNKQTKTFSLTRTINIICAETITNRFMEDIIDIFDNLATIRIRPQINNVINLHCNTDADLTLCQEMLDDLVRTEDLKTKFFPSLAIFEPNQNALSYTTSSYTNHLNMIKSLFKYLSKDGEVVFSQMYTNQSHGNYTIRVSLANEIKYKEVKQKLNLTQYKTIEQIRSETPENVSECLFPPTHSEKEIIDGVKRAFDRIGQNFNNNQCSFSQIRNHSNTVTLKLCRITHSDKDELDKFIDKKIILNTKHNIANGKGFKFAPSTAILDLKIEKKNKHFPFLNKFNPTEEGINNQTNCNPLTESKTIATKTPNPIEGRLDNLEKQMYQMKETIIHTNSNIDRIIEALIVNKIINPISTAMQDEEPRNPSSSTTFQSH